MSKPADTLLAQINGGDSYSNEHEIICEAINTRPLPDVIFYLGIFLNWFVSKILEKYFRKYLIYININTDDYELPRANISRVNVTVDDPPQTGGLSAADLKDDRMFSVRDTYRYRAQVRSNYCTKSNTNVSI